MQHPDEGTIHAWLDGALSADDARALEAHVAGCAACAAAVTEARGLLAASSRILAALDSVPGGVLPAAEPESGKDERVVPIGRSSLWRSPGWRAAAAIVLVGSVSWLATRSVGRQGEGSLASPTEISSAGASDSAARSAARTEMNSVASGGEHPALAVAPRIAQSGPRQQATGNKSKVKADAPVVVAAPPPQVVVAPQAMPYAMPKFAESPNAGAGADAGLSMRSAEKAAARAKSSAPRAVSGSLSRLDASPTLDVEAARLAGCYSFETAASQSSVPGIRSALSLVPAQVELLVERDSSAAGSWRILRSAPGAVPLRLAARASWRVLAADSVNLELSEGMESVSARFEVKGDSLHGNATVTAPALPGGEMALGSRGSRMPCVTP